MSVVSPCAPPVPAAHGSQAAAQILQRWRRQIAGRLELAERRGIRPFALVGYRVHGVEVGPLVPLERLSFVALYDERDDDDRLLTRLVGVRSRFESGDLLVGVPRLAVVELDTPFVFVRSEATGVRETMLRAIDECVWSDT